MTQVDATSSKSIDAVLRIASRGSQLALWQAEAVKSHIQRDHPSLQVGIEIIRTTGDKILDVPLSRIGQRGLFTKEIDEAILDGRADLAVHSLKDVSTTLPNGLVLAAVSEREDPRDVLISRHPDIRSIADLQPRARVGTSSLRRRAQLRQLRPDLEIVDLRGNLNTRFAKLDSGDYDAIILAAAGVIRLGWTNRISAFLEPAEWLPAVGQGALAVVARADDDNTAALLTSFHDPATAACVAAERSLLNRLEGGCQVPIGALATLVGGRLTLDGLVTSIDGDRVLRGQSEGDMSEAAEIGYRLAGQLLREGADEILAEIRRDSAPIVTAP
jgi:hydroxymethylbilane synthase